MFNVFYFAILIITYFFNGTKILSQSDGINTLVFQYGANGVEGFTLNGAQYVYQKNILGDIIGIFDNNQQLIAKYAYDAWGNQTVYAKISDNMIDITGQSMYNTNIANINPFRYRGYYYDVETGFYYLNSRYYDPALGRFINADDINAINATKITTNGLNLYSYCLNNPVNETDESGYILWWLIAAIVVGALVGGTVNGISAYNQGYRGWDLVGSILGGAIMGGAMGGLLAFGGGVAVGAITGATVGKGILISAIVGISAGWGSYAVQTAISPSKQWNTKDFAIAGLSGLLKGLFTYSIGLLSGKVGGFDKLILNPILKGSPAYLKNIIYAFAKATIGRTAFLTPFAEFILKSLSATLPAAAVRKLIDYIFGL